MNFSPEKFFIGIIDFFSILMPGAMLAYLGKDWVAMEFDLPKKDFALDSTEAGLVFLFASYLLLMELAEEPQEWPEESRQSVWLPLEDAKQKAFPETVPLLLRAAARLSRPENNKSPEHSDRKLNQH